MNETEKKLIETLEDEKEALKGEVNFAREWIAHQRHTVTMLWRTIFILIAIIVMIVIGIMAYMFLAEPYEPISIIFENIEGDWENQDIQNIINP